MSTTDGDYLQSSDSDDALAPTSGAGTKNYGTRGAKGKQARGKERWERGVQDATVREGEDGRLVTRLEESAEARKRKRLRQDTKPFQRGIIRHVVLALDLSEAMNQKDFRPNRLLKMLNYAEQYVGEFFEQNPISQMCVMGMYDGLCIRISEMSGNPTDHTKPISAMRETRGPAYKEPKGSPSLQNTLEQSRAALYHTPSHGTREVIIILGALLTLDPSDIHQTVKSCIKDRIRVGIIGMGGRMKICQDICSKTNSGDDSSYNVAVDQHHFRELLMATTTPPVIRSTADEQANPASLLMMGFPSRVIEDEPTLCSCHGNLTRGGYLCSRCQAKVCDLPATCPSCSMTLILSTHLARSYHHLFPLENWSPVTWRRAKQVGSTECRACMSPFPPLPDPLPPSAAAEDEAMKNSDVNANGKHQGDANDDDDDDDDDDEKEQKAAESSRYECRTCHNHFCVDCDLFSHTVVHNCAGCLGQLDSAAADDGADRDRDETGKAKDEQLLHSVHHLLDGFAGPGPGALSVVG